MGGAVNLISKKPTQPFEGSIGYGFSHGKSGGTATNKTDFNLGTKQELFYAQISGSFVEKQGLQLSHHYQQINPKGDDGGRAENSKQRDKKLSLKVAYTPNEHDEYALAFSTQKGTKAVSYTHLLQPNLIIDVGNVTPNYIDQAKRTFDQTGVPYLLLDGKLSETPTTLRYLGKILGVENLTEPQAKYADCLLYTSIKSNLPIISLNMMNLR